MFNKPADWKTVLVLLLVFLVVFASRITRIPTTEFDADEIRTVWLTLDTRLISESSTEWTPGYHLALSIWRSLVGMHPVILHVFSVFTFMLGVAFLYRVGRRLFERETPAILSILAYAALGYSIYLSGTIRAYGLLITLLLLTFWLLMRYFDYFSVPRGIALGVCLAALFYIHLASLFGFALFLIYTLVMYGRRIWRWGLPLGVGGLLSAPGVIAVLVIVARPTPIISVPAAPSPPLGEALLTSYQFYTGEAFVLWGLLFILAAVMLILRQLDRRALILVIWILFPVVALLAGLAIPGDPVRQVGWSMIGIALWIGFGITMLEGRARLLVGLGASVMFTVLMFLPVRMERYQKTPAPAMTSLFTWLSTNLRSGDVLLLDPQETQVSPEAWDYFTRAYFPDGLNFVTNPGDHRRIWYVGRQSGRDPDVEAAVGRDRMAGIAFVRGNLVTRLYERPANVPGILFANGLHFHGMDVIENGTVWNAPLVRQAGQDIFVRLWWSVDAPPPMDYGIGLYLVDAVGQPIWDFNDAVPPDAAATGTSSWRPGHYHLKERQLRLPDTMPSGQYFIGLAVYEPELGQRIPAPGVDEQFLLPIQQVAVR